MRTVLPAVLLLVANAACISYAPPARFLVTERTCDEAKALTPEESKVWLRTFEDDKRGGLAFWVDALKDDLLKTRGYILIEESEVQTGGGTPGKALVLETSPQGRATRELLAVFVNSGLFADEIRVLEYVAEQPAFMQEVGGVRGSLKSLR